MSSRYGRNQRRKHRDELAAAMKQNEHLEANVRLLRETGRRNADAIRMTAEVLGQHFMTLPDSPQMVDEIPESIRLPKQMRFRGYVADDIAEPLQYTLYLLETNGVELRLDDLQNAVRVTYTTPDGPFSYAMSRSAWDRLPPEALRELVAREIAHAIAAQVVTVRDRKRQGGAA